MVALVAPRESENELISEGYYKFSLALEEGGLRMSIGLGGE